jgi:hypothetical protein
LKQEKNTSLFTRQFIAANRLGRRGFSNWLFYPGMFFLDRNKWWGDQGPRPTPHEGVDLCFYRTDTGGECRLYPQARIPAVTGGRVLGIIDDFLGKSIVVHHAGQADNGWRICTIYGHTRPLAGLSTGSRVTAGEVIASLSHNGGPGGPGPHLHVSLALISDHLPAEGIDWPALNDPKMALFLDPLRSIMALHPLSMSPLLSGQVY